MVCSHQFLLQLLIVVNRSVIFSVTSETEPVPLQPPPSYYPTSITTAITQGNEKLTGYDDDTKLSTAVLKDPIYADVNTGAIGSVSGKSTDSGIRVLYRQRNTGDRINGDGSDRKYRDPSYGRSWSSNIDRSSNSGVDSISAEQVAGMNDATRNINNKSKLLDIQSADENIRQSERSPFGSDMINGQSTQFTVTRIINFLMSLFQSKQVNDKEQEKKQEKPVEPFNGGSKIPDLLIPDISEMRCFPNYLFRDCVQLCFEQSNQYESSPNLFIGEKGPSIDSAGIHGLSHCINDCRSEYIEMTTPGCVTNGGRIVPGAPINNYDGNVYPDSVRKPGTFSYYVSRRIHRFFEDKFLGQSLILLMIAVSFTGVVVLIIHQSEFITSQCPGVERLIHESGMQNIFRWILEKTRSVAAIRAAESDRTVELTSALIESSN